MHAEVSVIIVSWNTRDILLDCLRSLYDQTRTPIEVIVVDNDSSDGSADAVERAYPMVRVVRSGENVGFAKANNRGLAEANGRYTLFLNPDTVILNRAVDAMLHWMQKHPHVGVLGPHTFDADGTTTQHTVKMSPSLRRMYHTHVPVWRLVPGWHPELAGETACYRTGPVEVVKGCCMLMPTQLVRELGGMSEKHFMYSEEDDLCRRAAERGFGTWYLHEASIIHLGGEATKQNSAAMVMAQVEAWTDVFRQYNPDSSVTAFKLLLGFGSLWRWIAWSPLTLVASKREVAFQRMREHTATLKALILR